jgi:hypothetical protein
MRQRRCIKALTLILIFVLGNLISSQVSSDAEEGLVAYFKFDEASGGDIIDASGLEHDGEATGDTDRVEGKFGKGMQFDGKASHATVPAGTLGTFEAATMTAWVKVFKMPSTNSYNIVGMTSGPGAGFYLELYGGTLAAWQCEPNMNASLAYSAVGEWHHLAAVYTGTDILIYIDGEQKAKAGGTALPNVSNMPLMISGNHAETDNFGGSLDGVVDEVRIYNRALEADEIKDTMEEFTGDMAVAPVDKLSATWAEVKSK